MNPGEGKPAFFPGILVKLNFFKRDLILYYLKT